MDSHTVLPDMQLLELPSQVLDLIVEKIGCLKDVVRLAATCRTIQSRVSTIPLSLDLSGGLGKDSLQEVAESWRGIRQLDLSGLPLHDTELIESVHLLPELRTVILDRCQKLTGYGVQQAISQWWQPRRSRHTRILAARAGAPRHGVEVLSLQRCFRIDATVAANILFGIRASSPSPRPSLERLSQDSIDSDASGPGSQPPDSALPDHSLEEGDAAECSMKALMLSHLVSLDGALLELLSPAAGLRAGPSAQGGLQQLQLLALHNCTFTGATSGRDLLAALALACPALTALMLGGSPPSSAKVASPLRPLRRRARSMSAPGQRGDAAQSAEGERASTDSRSEDFDDEDEHPEEPHPAVAALSEFAVLACSALPRLMILEVTMHAASSRHVATAAVAAAEREVSRVRPALPLAVWDFTVEACVAEAAQLLGTARKLPARGGGPASPPPRGAAHPDLQHAGPRGASWMAEVVHRVGREGLQGGVRAAARCSGRGRETPLHYASERGEAALVQLLLAVGALVDARDARGATPLFVASEGGCARTVAPLVEGGADVMLGNIAGEIPLYISALKGHKSAMQVLLGRCQDAGLAWQLAESYGDGWSPLMAAVVAHRPDIAMCLITAAAEATHSRPARSAPLLAPACRGPPSPPLPAHHTADLPPKPMATELNPHAKPYFDDQEPQNKLQRPSPFKLRHDAPVFCPSAPATHAVTSTLAPAHVPVAVSAGCNQARGEKRASPGEALPQGNSTPPLVLAANRFGQTALHIAARTGDVDMLHLLIHAGANLNAQDSYGLTPAQVADTAKHREAQRVLKVASRRLYA